MSSYTFTDSVTFTVTHARHIAAKVATDLKRLQRLYGSPSDGHIADLEAEAVALMKAGYLDTVTYGFQRGGSWVEPTLRYAARDLAGGSADDDDPGRIRASADVSGAHFTSFLVYSSAYLLASDADRAAFEGGQPIRRTTGTEPPVSGYLTRDRTYSAGGRALDRHMVRSF